SLPFFRKGGASEITWIWGKVIKQDLLDGKGRVLAARRLSGTLASEAVKQVDYASRTWWRFSGQLVGVPISTCSLLPVGLEEAQAWTPRNLAKGIRHSVKCGLTKVAGHQHVDGVNAIKLIFTDDNVGFDFGSGEQTVRQTLWVDPASYLPVRLRSELVWVG